MTSGASDPTLPLAVTPVSVGPYATATVPALPVAVTPLSPVATDGVSVPTLPVAVTPAGTAMTSGVSVPALPVAVTPCSATPELGSALRGDSDKLSNPSVIYVGDLFNRNGNPINCPCVGCG